MLYKHRGVPNQLTLPRLSEEQILAWCDVFHQKEGRWPTRTSGAIPDSDGATWMVIDTALRAGLRGLAGASTLARLLYQHRGVPNQLTRQRLSEEQILAWCDAFHQKEGRWPTRTSGAIPDSDGETWRAISLALQRGWRGLPGGSSLAKLLAQKRGQQPGPP